MRASLSKEVNDRLQFFSTLIHCLFIQFICTFEVANLFAIELQIDIMISLLYVETFSIDEAQYNVFPYIQIQPADPTWHIEIGSNMSQCFAQLNLQRN